MSASSLPPHDHIETTHPAPTPAPPQPVPPAPAHTTSVGAWIGRIILGVAVAGGVLTYWNWDTKHRAAKANEQDTGHAQPVSEGEKPAMARVEVITPRRGGIDRNCVQPGTLEPFEAADLYAKVSGFLATQSVDIGSRVKKGQVLATIAVPEYEEQVKKDAARVENAKAAVKQAEARVDVALAEARSAEAYVGLAKAQVNAKTSYRKYREKQLNRLRQLEKDRAIEAKIVDESEDQFQAAVEAQAAAVEGVTAAQEKASAARARIAQVKADLEEAKAGVDVGKAELGKSSVLLEYSKIISPYEGVVTKRSFNRGDFIRSADAGGDRTPLLAVERTDKMRIVVFVPDSDVPYVDIGDPATMEIAALSDGPIKGTVSRSAQAEDPSSRTMRTEIDVFNKDGKLRRGMYGLVTIKLQVGVPTAVNIPVSALASKADATRGSVWVAKNGKAHLVAIRLGANNGVDVEVLSGLAPDDQVIVHSSSPLKEGAAINLANAT